MYWTGYLVYSINNVGSVVDFLFSPTGTRRSKGLISIRVSKICKYVKKVRCIYTVFINTCYIIILI